MLLMYRKWDSGLCCLYVALRSTLLYSVLYIILEQGIAFTRACRWRMDTKMSRRGCDHLGNKRNTVNRTLNTLLFLLLFLLLLLRLLFLFLGGLFFGILRCLLGRSSSSGGTTTKSSVGFLGCLELDLELVSICSKCQQALFCNDYRCYPLSALAKRIARVSEVGGDSE